MKLTVTVISCVLFLSMAGMAQTTYWVDITNTTGPWLGTQNYPFYYIGVDTRPGIDGGIEKAVSGDTIIVRPGTYYENLDYDSKDLVIMSSDGAAVTTVDGMQLDSVVKMQSVLPQRLTRASVLEGFTITNGLSSSYGGGIHCINSDSVIRGNIIGLNESIYGGGIFCEESNPLIEQNEISNNKATYQGGAVYKNHATSTDEITTFYDNDILNNVAEGTSTSGGGGGIYCYYASPIIMDNRINGNVDYYAGGGIHFQYYCYNPVVTGNTFDGNESPVGGAVYTYNNVSLEIKNNIVINNVATKTGGGLCFSTTTGHSISGNYIWNNIANGTSANTQGGGGIYIHYGHGDSHLTNNIICGNKAPNGYGGGIFFDYYNNLPVMNNTICSNQAEYGGGAFFRTHCTPVITNTIYWHNEASISGQQVYVDSTSDPTFSYGNMEGGWTGTGEKNLSGDPLDEPQLDQYCHLTKTSPCINRGTIVDAPIEDIDGESRPCMGVLDVDIGADEYIDTLPLEAETLVIDSSVGGTVHLYLDAGSENKDRIYFTFGSMSGTNPGFVLPKLIKILPIQFDLLTVELMNIAIPLELAGYLDSQGQKEVIIPLPPDPNMSGIKLSLAFATLKPYDFVSNPVTFDLQ